MDKPRLNITLAIVSAVLGILLSTSFFTHQKLVKESPTGRKTELIETINDLENDREELKKQLTELRDEVTDLQKTAAANEGVLTSFSKEVKDLEFIAGLTPVKGPGVEVVLSDSKNIPLGGDPNSYIIHDYDLKTVVNTLWSGGAEAIAINTQRLVNDSSIRCVGNTIMVNSTRLVEPYHVRAIGEPAKLSAALEKDEQSNQLVNEFTRIFNLKITVNKKKDMNLNGYEGSIQLKYSGVED